MIHTIGGSVAGGMKGSLKLGGFPVPNCNKPYGWSVSRMVMLAELKLGLMLGPLVSVVPTRLSSDIALSSTMSKVS